MISRDMTDTEAGAIQFFLLVGNVTPTPTTGELEELDSIDDQANFILEDLCFKEDQTVVSKTSGSNTEGARKINVDI